jgi:hypothetical protein
MMTVFINEAAAVEPASWNAIVNGEVVTDLFERFG